MAEGPIRKWLCERKTIIPRKKLFGSSGSERKELCLKIVDALDDPKHLLSDAYTLYEEGLRDKAIGLVRTAPEKAERIRREALAKGAPEVVTEQDIDYITLRFKLVEDYMKMGVPPNDLEDLVYDIDGELYKRMFQKFHECMTRG